MRNQCRKQVKKQRQFDHDFEAKMVPKIDENRVQIEVQIAEKSNKKS